MNKILLTIHWIFSLLIVGISGFLKIKSETYNLSQNIYFSMGCFVLILIILTFMLIRNSKDNLIHSLISITSLGVIFKMNQLGLEKFFIVYVLILLYGIQIYMIDRIDRSKWTIWTYFIVIYVFMPFYGISRIYQTKPVLTSIFDNDLLSLYGSNVFFSGLGYMASGLGMKNYLAYGPLIYFLGLTGIIFVFYIYKNKRRDYDDEKNFKETN